MGALQIVAHLEACAHVLAHLQLLAPGLKATVVKQMFLFALMALGARVGLVATATVGEHSARLITRTCVLKQVPQLRGRTSLVTQHVAPGVACAPALSSSCRLEI